MPKNKLKNKLNFTLTDFKLLNFQRLTGMSFNKIYQFNYQKRSYILRILNIKRPKDNRLNEINNTRTAGKLGLGPELIYPDQTDTSILASKVMILEFIDASQPLTKKSLSHPDKFQKTIKTISKLHHSGESFGKMITPFDRTRFFLQQARKNNPPNLQQKMIIKEILKNLKNIEILFKHHAISTSPCHFDLNPGNIIFHANHHVKLIDWEDSCQSDAFFDLASLAFYYKLNQKKSDALLKIYLKKNPSEKNKAHLYMLKQVCLLMMSAWLYLKHSQKSDIKIKNNILLQLKKIRANQKTAEFLKYKNILSF